MIVKLLKTEYDLEETNGYTIKTRITPEGETGTLTGKITNKNGFVFDLDWSIAISDDTVQKPTYDLSLVSFTIGTGSIGLTIGKHTLTVTIDATSVSVEFWVVPITMKRFKKQYLLGVELESQAKLTFQQDLRLITGVDLVEISTDSTVGVKELVYNNTNKSLKWDNGVEIIISEDYDEYILTDYLCEPGTMDGNYITVLVEDIDNLPSADITESVIVDIFRWGIEDFRRSIMDAHDYVCNSEIWTQLYPDYYSYDRADNAIYLGPADLLPSSLSESRFQRFELSISQLIEIVELKMHPFGDIFYTLNLDWIEIKEDGRVELRGYSFQSGGHGTSTYYAGNWDKTIYADFRVNQKNTVKNYWNAKVIAGITNEQLRRTCLDVIAKVALLNMYIWAASGRDQGIASRSFSASGVSSSYATTSSAEYGVYSANIAEVSKQLGVGNVTADQKRNGLLGKLKTQIEGGSNFFKA